MVSLVRRWLNLSQPTESLEHRQERRFPLLRYYLLTSLAVIVVITALVAFFLVRKAEGDFAERSANRGTVEAAHLSHVFYRSLWESKSQGANATLGNLLEPGEVNNFFEMITFGLDVAMLNLLDVDGKTLWSSSPGMGGVARLDDSTLQVVVHQGNGISNLLQDQSIRMVNGLDQELDVVRTAYPIRDVPLDVAREGRIIGVIEIYQDVTDDLSQAKRDTLLFAVFGSIGSGTVLFALLFLIVYRGDRMLLRGRYRLLAQQQELENALEELRRTQQQIVQQERLRAMGLMASGIAHDLNNALTPVVGYSDLILGRPESLDDREKSLRWVTTINKASKDAVEVIKRLREFYRLRGEEENFRPLSIDALLNQVVELTQPNWQSQAQARNAHINVVTDFRTVPGVEGDEAALREVLVNLIINATDALPQGGNIYLRTYASDGRVIVEVRDDGIGMSEEVRSRCLEIFFTTKGERGSGLGLGIADGIVRRHGGIIEVESTLGQGTTVRISLPVVHHDVMELQPEAEEPRPHAIRALVVDDDPLVRETISEYLVGDGSTVETATNGREGLEKFRNSSFDLVFADRAMPEMNGDQLAASIHQMSPHTPVVMLTGFGDQMLASGTVPPGVSLVLSKPITLASLRQALAQAVPGGAIDAHPA